MILDTIRKLVKEGSNLDFDFEFADRFSDICLSPGEINRISHESGKSPEELISSLDNLFADKLTDLTEKTEYLGGFYNIHIKNLALAENLRLINKDLDLYLIDSDKKGETVIIDYSSPNIAKPFSVGHLRSTIIGQANLACHQALGYKTVGVNHIGDWGTQFGKLIVAIKRWGDEGEIEKDPIRSLNNLYVKFHKEQEEDSTLEDEARNWFTRLEQGDKEAQRLWKKCVTWSLAEFDRIYDRLGIHIESVKGESFYHSHLEGVVVELKEKKLLEKSENAQIVKIGDLPPALIKKSDGSTLYMTRDLAALKYRIKEYNPKKIIYHVGNDQALHFRQLEEVAKKLGWLDGSKIVFAGHGLLRLPEGKMSTRLGKTILLEDLIEEAVTRSLKIIEDKNPDLKNKKDIAEKIGISAIKYSDLSQNRKSDIEFSFDRAISLEGNSGPYLQYTYARISSLIRKYEDKFSDSSSELKVEDNFREIAMLIVRVKETLRKSANSSMPSMICDHAFKIANAFNSYYEKQKIVSEDEKSSSIKIQTIYLIQKVLGKLIDILGIDRLEEI